MLLLFSTTLFAREPKYQKPQVNIPLNWQAPAPWREAVPKDSLGKGTWWLLFADPELNQYEDRALANNQSLKAAVARLAEARSFARITAANNFPQLSANPSANRERLSGNRSVLGGTAATTP